MNQDAAIIKHSHLMESYDLFYNIKNVRFQNKKSFVALKVEFSFIKRKITELKIHLLKQEHLELQSTFFFLQKHLKVYTCAGVAFQESLAISYRLNHRNCPQGNSFLCWNFLFRDYIKEASTELRLDEVKPCLGEHPNIAS